MKIAIIGAGPIGLYAAFKCKENNIDYTVFEAGSFIGGQLTHLYPQKDIVNIPGIQTITAENYIELLSSKIDSNKIKLNAKITDLTLLENEFDVIIVATGIGEYIPRKLGLVDEEKYNVLYSLNNYGFLKDKKVIIFGGGDSALDWAKQLSDIACVSLVHRRDEFRGNVDTIKDCSNLDIFLSYIPYAINEKYITIKSIKDDSLIDLEYDYILVNFGNVTVKSKFNITNKTYIVGDYLGQTRTIAFGNESVNKVFEELLNENN